MSCDPGTSKPAVDRLISDRSLSKALRLLGIPPSVTAPLLTATVDLGRSPAGTVSADRGTFVAGDTVNFTVRLDPATVSLYPVIGPYNVRRVFLARVKPGETLPAEVGSATATSGQTEFKIAFKASDSGSAAEFTGFVVTTLLPFGRREVAILADHEWPKPSVPAGELQQALDVRLLKPAGLHLDRPRAPAPLDHAIHLEHKSLTGVDSPHVKTASITGGHHPSVQQHVTNQRRLAWYRTLETKLSSVQLAGTSSTKQTRAADNAFARLDWIAARGQLSFLVRRYADRHPAVITARAGQARAETTLGALVSTAPDRAECEALSQVVSWVLAEQRREREGEAARRAILAEAKIWSQRCPGWAAVVEPLLRDEPLSPAVREAPQFPGGSDDPCAPRGATVTYQALPLSPSSRTSASAPRTRSWPLQPLLLRCAVPSSGGSSPAEGRWEHEPR
jgi:hypothetical protein